MSSRGQKAPPKTAQRTQSLGSNLFQGLRPRNILRNLLAGLLAAVVTLAYSVSYGLLIFSSCMHEHTTSGIMSALISACVIGLVVTLGSSLFFSIAGPDSNSTAVLALMAATIVAGVRGQYPHHSPLPTVLLALSLTSVLTGVLLFVLGALKLGRFIRFIPFPVVGGFLAGTGWLITSGAFTVMTGAPLNLRNLRTLASAQFLLNWLPGLALALVLLLILRRYKHFLILPLTILVSAFLFHGVLWLAGIPLHEARLRGLLFAPIETSNLSLPFLLNFDQIHWTFLLEQSSNFLAMVVVVAITILLNATGLDLATQSDVDFDQELRSAGAANTLAGFLGGMVGYQSISRSVLNYKAGANSRLAGVFAALILASITFFFAPALAYLPKPILGGLLLYLGLALLVEWVYDASFRMNLFDYILLLSILILVATSGFLTGVSFGVIVACLLFAYSYSRINVIKVALDGSTHTSNVERSFTHKEILREEGDAIYMLRLQGFIFFGTANGILDHLRQQLGERCRFLLLDFRLVTGLDSSAVLSFIKMSQYCQDQEIYLIFTNLHSSFEQLMRQGGFPFDEGGARIFKDLDRGLEWCEDRLLSTGEATIIAPPGLMLQLSHQFPDPDKLRSLLGYLEPLDVPQRHTIFRQGDPPDALYFVEFGQVSILLDLGQGKTKRLRTLGPGTVVGEMGLYLNSPRSASVVSDCPSRVQRLTIQAMETMQRQEPELASEFHSFVIRLLSERLSAANEELRILLQ